MDKAHENKLTMYLGVKSLLEGNKSKTDTVGAFTVPLGKFISSVSAVERKAKEFDMAVRGKTHVKTDAEETLIDELIPAISALAAYAYSVKDTEILVKASVPESVLRRLRDTELVTKAEGLFELVDSHSGKLVEYGVTVERIGSLRSAIDAYATALGKKESGYSDRTSARKALFDLFDETDAILGKQLDPMMEQFRKRETEFYDAYFNARFIRHLGAARKEKPAAVQMAAPAN